ncbi:methyltransferase domain-containing protein [Candidatus Parcubacteria bacterium]|nr:MAG: methyltransferase domain-containing protein [Candidatus Parcubacteria bacterium]
MDIKEDEIKSFLENATWYHTLEFPKGLTSKGVYDHREHLRFYKIPQSLKEMSVLDVGCADGFFSFEFEKKGAKEVLAVDTNKSDGTTAISPSLGQIKSFDEKYLSRQNQNSKFLGLAKRLGLKEVHLILMAKKLLNSSINYQNYSIYDLVNLKRSFDLVFCGDLIEHLKNPVEATEQLYLATKKLCIITLATLSGSKKANWWLKLLNLSPSFKDRIVTYWGDRGGTFFHFSPEAFKKLALASGFSKVEIVSRFNLKNFKTNTDVPHVVYHCFK